MRNNTYVIGRVIVGIIITIENLVGKVFIDKNYGAGAIMVFVKGP